MPHTLTVSEVARVSDQQKIVCERGISSCALQLIGDAALPVALHRDGQVECPGISASRVLQPRLDGERVARSAEAEAATNEVFHLYSFIAQPKLFRQTANMGKRIGHASVHQVLVGNRHVGGDRKSVV